MKRQKEELREQEKLEEIKTLDYMKAKEVNYYTVLEIVVGHWPFSNQFQHLASQNSFW